MSEIVVMQSEALAKLQIRCRITPWPRAMLQFLSETKADKKEVAELRVANRQLEEQ